MPYPRFPGPVAAGPPILNPPARSCSTLVPSATRKNAWLAHLYAFL
jgi:hypothetical protein